MPPKFAACAPDSNTYLVKVRRHINIAIFEASWLARRKLRVQKLGEMPHPELYAAAAAAAIFAPAVLRESLKKSNALLPVGELEGARYRMYALTAGKSLRHPALDAVIRSAKELR